MFSRDILKTYYDLTKPGIVYGNAIVAVAGYLYGAAGAPVFSTLAAMLGGISLVMASACVYNNVLDRRIDARMSRTQKRSLVTGVVSPRKALVFASILLAVGAILLGLFTNLLTLAVALFGHVAYVILYGWAKRTTVHSTLVGTISGATPPVIGYVASTGQLDVTALLLFVILVTWQMPHFYAIALFRRNDYAAAGVPVLSVVKGLEATKHQMIAYTVLFVVSCALLGLYGGSSLFTALVLLLAGSYWLYLCLQHSDDAERWARKQFGWSLSVLMILSATLSLDSFWH